MVTHLFLKKLNDFWPSKENIAKILADDMPSLRSFTPKPGTVFVTEGVVKVVSEIRMIACLVPLNMPV